MGKVVEVKIAGCFIPSRGRVVCVSIRWGERLDAWNDKISTMNARLDAAEYAGRIDDMFEDARSMFKDTRSIVPPSQTFTASRSG